MLWYGTTRGRIAAALIALAGAAASPAQTVFASDPQSIVRTLQQAGYGAQLGTDAEGDPKISSAASGAKFYILFYGCTNHTACRSIQITAGYTMRNKPSMDLMNTWNAKQRFTKAYLDSDGDPNLDMDVVMNGGLSTTAFSRSIELWVSGMGQFQKQIGW